MFKMLGKTLKYVGKNTVIGTYNQSKKVTGFIGSSLEAAKYDAVQEEMEAFQEELAFLSPEEAAAVIEMSKQKRLETMAERRAKTVVTNLQLTAKMNAKNKGGGIDAATLAALAQILKAQG